MAVEDEPVPGVPEWVVTYGDMMSLLLTFFIMLVSMSELKEDKGAVRAMLDAIRQTFGPTKGYAGVPGTSLQTTSALSARNSDGSRAEGGTKRASRKSDGPAGAHRTAAVIDGGAVVTLGGPARFGRFDAALTDALKADLDVIAGVLESKPNRVMVRGHATREPIPAGLAPIVDGFEVRDRWDLSYARARAVADYLVERGLDRRRLLVGAGGDARAHLPSAANEARDANRRVDVFILDSYISPLEPAGAAAPSGGATVPGPP